MSDEQFPIFPPEIEEIIFSLCFFNDRKSALNLILVAKRVHQWIIPQIYSVALFHPEFSTQYGPRYTTLSLLQYGKIVRHMFIYNIGDAMKAGMFEEPEDCLAKCPNVADLALWIRDPQADQAKRIIDQLLGLRHLKYLSFNLHPYLSHSVLKNDPGTDIPEHAFSTVTHLELTNVGYWMTGAEPRRLEALFPALTHLAFIVLTSGGVSPTTTSVLRNQRLNRRLEVFIWYLGCSSTRSRGPEVVPTSAYAPGVDDPRVVVMWYGQKYPDTWFEGVTGGRGIWRVAEEAIRERRKALTS